jgi:hypothetical protein
MNQLVANVDNCHEVIPDTLIEVFLHEVRIVRALFAPNVGPFSVTDILKTLAHQAEQCWTTILFNLES